MIREAFVMAVHPDAHAEYERRHSPIWPEMEETSQLFAYVEFEDEARWNAVAQTDVCRRWWASIKTLMPSNPDNSPQSVALRSVFHME